jgi:hypothetical protein
VYLGLLAAFKRRTQCSAIPLRNNKDAEENVLGTFIDFFENDVFLAFFTNFDDFSRFRFKNANTNLTNYLKISSQSTLYLRKTQNLLKYALF